MVSIVASLVLEIPVRRSYVLLGFNQTRVSLGRKILKERDMQRQKDGAAQNDSGALSHTYV